MYVLLYSLALFYFEFEGNFQFPGGLYLEGYWYNGGVLRYEFGGLIFGGAYTWWGLFSEFYGKHDLGFRRAQSRVRFQ